MAAATAARVRASAGARVGHARAFECKLVCERVSGSESASEWGYAPEGEKGIAIESRDISRCHPFACDFVVQAIGVRGLACH